MEADLPPAEGADGPVGHLPRRWSWPLLVLLVGILVYANTLALGFTFDDDWLILSNPRIADPVAYVRYLVVERKVWWRPVKRISLALDYAIWGPQRPYGFHATNVVLHALVSLALYGVARRLGLRRPTAGLAALLFAVHPVHVEAIANISHRKEPLALLFYLLAFLAYLRARDPAAPSGPVGALLGRFLRTRSLAAARDPSLDSLRRARLARAEHLSWTCVCFFLGLLSKEVGAVMLPAVLVAYELLLRRDGRRVRPHAAAVVAMPLIAILGLLVWRGYGSALRDALRPEQVLMVTQGATADYGLLLLTAVQAFGTYAALLIWPWPLYVERVFPVARSATDPLVLLGLGALLAYAAAILVTARRAPAAAFALAFYGLNLVPVLNVVPLTYWLVAERFLYVPSAGIALLVALGIERLAAGISGIEGARARRLAAALAAAILVVHATLTFVQNRVWRDTWSLWSHTLRFNPRSARALQGTAAVLYEARDLDGAEARFREAIAYYPIYPAPRLGLAATLMDQGRFEEGVAEVETYICLDEPLSDPGPYLLLARGKRELGRFLDAAEALGCAVDLDPARAGAFRQLAQEAARVRGDADAVAVVERAVHALPADPELHLLRGNLLRKLGRYDEALFSYQRTSELDPTSPAALGPMAAVLLRLGRTEEAVRSLERSLALDPGQEDVRRALELIGRSTP